MPDCQQAQTASQRQEVENLHRGGEVHVHFVKEHGDELNDDAEHTQASAQEQQKIRIGAHESLTKVDGHLAKVHDEECPGNGNEQDGKEPVHELLRAATPAAN